MENYGTISALGAAGYHDDGVRPNLSDGINIAGGGTVINHAGATVYSADYGLAVYGTTTIENDGVITAPYTVFMEGAYTHQLYNSGTIDGSLYAIIASGGNDLVVNSGTITSPNVAISMGPGDDQLTLLPGSTITGEVDGGDGNDRVTLAGTGTGSFAGAVNFEHLDVASGDWTLTGSSSFSGGTGIDAGASLTGAAAVLTGAIVDYGTLTVDQPTDGSFAAALSGTGLFRKTGDGTLAIGSQGFTGQTDVAGGTLLLAGTLAIAGDFTQAAGWIYPATILSGSASSRIAVGGAAAIGSGATISIARGAGDDAIGTRYTLLTVAGGISGSYTLNQTALDGTELRIGEDSTNVYADLVRTGASLGTLAATRDQASVAAAFGALNADNAAYASLTLDPSDAAVRDALSQLSGDVHASARAAVVRDAMLAERAVNGRLDGGPAQPVGLWGHFVGGHGEDDGADGAADTKRTTFGGIGGYDVALGGGLRAGIAGGYTHSRLSLDGRDGSARLGTGDVLGYVGGAVGALRARAGVGYAWSGIDTRRSLSFAGFLDRDVAHYDGGVLHAFGELGYALPLGGGTVQPFVGGSALRIHTDHFAEQGGDAALQGLGQTKLVKFSDVGLKIDTPIVQSLLARAGVAWQHAFGSVHPDAVQRFGNDGTAFSISGASLSRNAVTSTLDIAWQVVPRIRVTLGYVGMIGGGSSDTTGHLALDVRL